MQEDRYLARQLSASKVIGADVTLPRVVIEHLIILLTAVNQSSFNMCINDSYNLRDTLEKAVDGTVNNKLTQG